MNPVSGHRQPVLIGRISCALAVGVLQDYTFRQLTSFSNRFANTLAMLGVAPGDCVYTSRAGESEESFAVQYAECHRAGRRAARHGDFNRRVQGSDLRGQHVDIGRRQLVSTLCCPLIRTRSAVECLYGANATCAVVSADDGVALGPSASAACHRIALGREPLAQRADAWKANPLHRR